jgi:hypothetical protein
MKTQQTTKGDFAYYSVAAGLRFEQFEHLSASDKKKLIRLIARIAEKSYRRGYQHGREPLTNRSGFNVDPAVLRFERSVDKSPFTDSRHIEHTAIERLFMECGELRELGFREL